MLHALASDGKVEAGQRRRELVTAAEREYRPHSTKAMDLPVLHGSAQSRPSIVGSPDAYGNQAMLRMGTRHTPPPALRPSRVGVLQRKCACGGGCPRCRGEAHIQPKLVISEPGDQFEQEADHIAERVMRMPDAAVPGLTGGQGTFQRTVERFIQRKCESCAEEERLAPKETDEGAAPRGPVAPEIVHQVLASPGAGLDGFSRAFFEPRFDHDFSGVRIHTDEQAAASARAVGASAFTVGHDIVFAAGRYAPRTQKGRELIAHELAHVLQQQPASAPERQRSGGAIRTARAAGTSNAAENRLVLQREDVDPLHVEHLPDVIIPPVPPELNPVPLPQPHRCRSKIWSESCEDLKKRGGPQVKSFEVLPGFDEYQFSCTDQPCDMSGSIIIVGHKSDFACGDTVSICAFGFRLTATVVDRRPNDLAGNEFIVSEDIASAFGSHDKPFVGQVFMIDPPSRFECCPEGAKPWGPGDFPKPAPDEALT